MKKSSAIHEKLCQGKDIFERMNYLHQASLLVAPKNIALASYYSSIMTGCAKKSVLRIEHNIKRTICKGCQCPLIPGKTAKVRLKSKKQKMIRTICCTCKHEKKIPMKKSTLWVDQPQAVLETFEYSLKKKADSTRQHSSNLNNDKTTSADINVAKSDIKVVDKDCTDKNIAKNIKTINTDNKKKKMH